MTKTALLCSISLLVLGGYAGTAQPAERSLSPPASMVPDNTGGNVRDRRGETLMPGDPSESAADRTLTQRIQQAVAADELLSIAAKNIKIITLNGVVTLWGPVTSLQEKESIGAKAQHIVGVNKVDNQLELKGP
jgi:hyperosmotically inducible periplasmic protein